MKFLKVIGIFVILFIIAFIGLILFAKSYLTDERLMTLVIPTVEKTLGRQIELKEMHVKIFKGIILKEIVIFEKDGGKKFLSSKELELKYQLLPLLRKKVVIDEISLTSPRFYIIRKRDGGFNFDGLTRSDRKKRHDKRAKAGISLLVSHIVMKDAIFSFHDETKVLPDISAQLGVNMKLKNLSHQGKAVSYSGDIDIQKVDLSYQGLKPTLKGKLKLNEKEANFDLLLGVKDETVSLKGKVTDYTTEPAINLDISTEKLKLDHIMALSKISKKVPSKKRKGKDKTTEKKDISVTGNIRIGRIVYKKMSEGPIDVGFKFKDDIINISKLQANIAKGLFSGTAKILVKAPEAKYKANINMKNIQPNLIAAFFMPQYRNLQTSLDGTVSIDNTLVDIDVIAKILEDKFNIKGKVQNYRKQPDINVNIVSKELNVDKILSLLDRDDKINKPVKKSKKEKDGVQDTKAKDFTARGIIDVKKVIYKKADIHNLKAIYTYDKNIFHLKEISGVFADGKFNIKGKVDFKKIGYEYNAFFDVRSVVVENLINTFIPKARDKIFGKLDFNFQFQGAGTEPLYLKKALKGEGYINLQDGKFKDTKWKDEKIPLW